MPGPTFMALEVRGSPGDILARIVRGGTFSELLGATGIVEAKSALSDPVAYQIRPAMKRFIGVINAAAQTGVWDLDPITGVWSQSFAFTPPSESPNEMIVVDTTIGAFLVTLSIEIANFSHWRKRNTSGVWSGPGTGAGGVTGGTFRLFAHKGIVYSVNGLTGGASWRIISFNPVTNAQSTIVVPTTPLATANTDSFFFSVDDRLFLYTCSNAAAVAGVVFEFAFGTWSNTGLVLPPITMLGGTGIMGGFRVGNDVFVFVGDDASSALRCLKFSVSTPGGALVLAEITAAIPAVLQAGSTIGTPPAYRLSGIVDTSSVPGSATAYLYFLPDDSLAALPTLFQWVDEFTPMTVAAVPQLTGESSVPAQFYGGGESFNGLGTATSKLVTTNPEGSAQGSLGAVISFSAWGNAVVVPHGAITGAITVGDVATQAPSGATGIVLRTSPNETWISQSVPAGGAAWIDTQLITFVGGAGGTATQNAAASGGAADNTVTPRFFLGPGSRGLGVPITGACTIVPGSVTGGNGAVESGSTIINVTADGRTFTWEWDFLSDGIPLASIDNLELFITRP